MWDRVITPHQGWFDFGLTELMRYGDLVAVLVKRDFVSVYKQTVLGPIWFVLQPVLTALVFMLLFGRIAKVPTGTIPPFLFYFSGLVMWMLFATNLTKTSDVFTNNSALFSKVYFPRLVVPIAVALTNLVTFAIQFSLFIMMMAAFGYMGGIPNVAMAVLLLAPLALYVGLLGLGTGLLVTSLTTRFRDLGYVTAFAVQLWMYLTPVAYPLSAMSRRLQMVMYINPMTAPIQTFRRLWFGQGIVDVTMWEISLATTVVLCLMALVLFSHVQKTSMDTV